MEPKKDMEAPAATSAGEDVENQTPPRSSGFGVAEILRRWKTEDFLKRASLALRGFGLLFSLLAFLIMASNSHGDWEDFDKYDEYKYVLAIAILSTLYAGLQVFRQVHELSTGRVSFPQRNIALIDFVGDQVVAYLLLSAASAAVPLTNNFRRGADNIFTDSAAASISMEFFAFFCLAMSAVISGFNLSRQTYI